MRRCTSAQATTPQELKLLGRFLVGETIRRRMPGTAILVAEGETVLGP